MRSHSDFWLLLHQLVGQIQQESAISDERIAHLVDALEAQAAPTKNISSANLEFAAATLDAIRDEVHRRAANSAAVTSGSQAE